MNDPAASCRPCEPMAGAPNVREAYGAPWNNSTRAAGPAGRSLRRLLLGWLAAVLAAACLVSSAVFVDETEFVIIERLGRIVAVYDNSDPAAGDRGLHFKLPWPISIARRFDRRLQLFDPPGREIFTSDKKNITVQACVCWRIAPPAVSADAEPASGAANFDDRPVVRFFRGLGGMPTAEARLESRIRSLLSTEMGQVELADLLKVGDSESGPQGDSPLEALAGSVLAHMRQRPDEADNVQSRLGIEVLDVRLTRINLPEGNKPAVYLRMESERKKIAQRYRSAGLAEKLVIESQADRQRDEILARARADADRIRGAGEAESIAILNRAHARDPEFYRIQRTLDSYRKILNERTTLVLSAGSSLFKLLTDGVPAAPVPGTDKSPPDSAPVGLAQPKVSQSQPPPQDSPKTAGSGP